jgi:very-short-patch-repair endonuclease
VGGAIAGRSAATLLGAGLSGPADLVEIIAPRSARPQHGDVITHSSSFTADEIRIIGGVPVTTALRTCWDLAQWLPVAEAVVLVDRLLHARLVTVAELAEYCSRRAGARGVRRFKRVVSYADGRAESPQESRLRVALLLAGLPAPNAQHEIYDASGFIARVDLAYEQWKIAMEYDGVWHAEGAQLHRDRQRLNRLQAAGWLVLHVTAERLRNDLQGVIREVAQAIHTRRRSLRT